MSAEWEGIKVLFCIVLSFLTFHLDLLFLIYGFGGNWPGVASASFIVGIPAIVTLITISYWRTIIPQMEPIKMVLINGFIFIVASFSVWHITTGNEGFRTQNGILN